MVYLYTRVYMCIHLLVSACVVEHEGSAVSGGGEVEQTAVKTVKLLCEYMYAYIYVHVCVSELARART